METIHAGLFSWRPLTLKLCYRSQRRSVHLSLLISPNARFPLRSNLLEHSSCSFRRKPILSNNPKFAVARANAGAGINGEIAALEADGSNGALQEDFTSGFFQQLSRKFAVVLSFLPGGSWWKVGDAVEDDSRGVTLITALRRIWTLIASDKIVLFAAFSTLLMAAISEISIPHFVTATVFSAQSQSKVHFYRNAKLLVLMCCSFGIFSGIRSCCFGIVNQILVRRMREKLFSTILSQDIAFFDIETVGVLTSRLGSDCQQVSGVIGNDFNMIFRNGLQGTGALLYLVMLSWRLALTTVLLCSLMSTIMLLYSRYQRNAAKCSQEVVAEANDVAQEALSSVRVVRTFGTEAKECERYSKWLKKLEGINLRQNVACGFWKWSSNTLYHGAQVVALLVGGGFVMDGHLTAEQLTKFIMYSEWVMHSAWWVGDYWSSLMQSIGASEKVFELIELPLCKQVTSQGLKLRQLEGRIEFVNLSFNYPSRPMVPVLQNINLSICPGELVAVVGLSGSGKSTLLGLLLRLYEAASGQILIDGIPLNELDVKWFRSKVGVVSQEPRLFNMDIASNISYGCVKKFGQRDIEWAAKQADAHEFIMSLPDGYKTLIDNARLSGGQKQRIAIARAVLREPTILVLDEATSALDAESENYVKQAIERIVRSNSRRKCTVLVITHRLSTICTADRIVVMKSGEILEILAMEGSHHYVSHFAQTQQEEGQPASSIEEMDPPLQEAARLSSSHSTRLQVAPRWTLTEMLVLVREKWAVENELQISPSKSQFSGVSDKWSIISNHCAASHVQRTAGQCRKKWELLISDYKKIKEWERQCGVESYWNLSHSAKREHKLPFYLERELFDVMDANLDKTPTACPDATFDSMDVAADSLFTSNDDSQDEMVKMQDPTASGSGNEPLDSTVRHKRRRCSIEDDREHDVISVLRENCQNIQAVIRETTQAQMCSSQLDRDMYWKGIEVNKQVQLQTSELDRELKRKQGQDLIDVLGGLVNAVNRLVDTIQNKSSQQLNGP